MGQDESIQIGAKASQSVTCAQCQRSVAPGEYYTYKGKGGELYLCGACRESVEQTFQAETKGLNLVMAILLGVIGAAAAGAIWHFIVVFTGYEIGYVAIGVGYCVGFAVHWGSGRKRGAVLQFLSAGLTLVTLLAASYFTFLHLLRKYLLEQKMEGYTGQFFFISPLEPDFLKGLVSPIGLVIWAIALYVAFSVPKPRTA